MKLYDAFKKGAMTALALSLLASGIPFSRTAHVDAAEVSNSTFDEENIDLRFGVLSDIHMAGYAASDGLSPDLKQAKQQKLDKAYKTLKYLADEDNNSTLDMVLINGDITDAMNSSGNIWGNVPKLQQNYFEIASFRDITLNNFKDSSTKILYSHGNHDTENGVSLDENKTADTTGFWGGSLFRKILSGYKWTNTVPDNDNPTAQQIADYNKEQLTEYEANDGYNYNFFYENDKTDEDTATIGNRHFLVGGYHFITVEPESYHGNASASTYTEETIRWLDETLDDITNEDSTKPIFVGTHARVDNTIYASSVSASTALIETLNKYPQVIVWGGHEHTALNRELGIWQGDFTAVDTGVVSYLVTNHLDYEPYGDYPSNGIYSGWGNLEYHNASQGEYVEVDKYGNVRIHRIDFYHSDLTEGSVKIAEIGEPWIIDAPKSDKSHLTRYNTTNRASGNTAPTFGNGAVTATVSGDTIKVSFPAATDDKRVISYYVELKNGSSTVEKKELTSFYYDHADASELDGTTYSTTFTECGVGDYTVSVTAIDDYGATASIEKDVEIKVVPHKELDLTKLNQEWTGATGVLTHGVNFNGRVGVSKVTKSQSDLSSASQIVMNYGKAASIADISQTPYLLIDYYYEHDDSSAKAAASTMRWRPWVNKNGSWIESPCTATLETNRWATAVIQLDPEFLVSDNYQHTKYKFEPFGTTAAANLDDNDALYISGIRFSATKPETTEVEFALSNLAKGGWQDNTPAGAVDRDASAFDRTGLTKFTKDTTKTENLTSPIIGEAWVVSVSGHNVFNTPKLVVEYYYKHDTASTKTAASSLKFRFFIGNVGNGVYPETPAEATIEPNKWATAEFTLDKSFFERYDRTTFNQVKFYPFGMTAAQDLDDGDEMYIAKMYFVPETEPTFTESGVAYVNADGYIENVYARVYTTIADAAASLGSYGGTVYVKGDVIIDDTKKLDNGTARGKVTIQGYGDTLAEQQNNRVWFSLPASLRTTYGGDTEYDRITLKAPTDEAGFYSNHALTIGSNVKLENGSKSDGQVVYFNLGGTDAESGINNVTVNTGTYDSVATYYRYWDKHNTGNNIGAHYTLNSTWVTNVYAGTRNTSATDEGYTITGDVTYDFNCGTFVNVYTGHYKHGKITGNVLYNVNGGTFTNGITFGNASASDNASVSNVTVLIDGKSDKLTKAVTVKNGTNAVSKASESSVWSAIVNNAEGAKGTIDAGVTADYKLYVYGGSAEPVFNDDKTLKGFSITNANGYAPVIDGTILGKNSDGLYDLSAYKNTETVIYFNELGIDPIFGESTAGQDKKLTVAGAQIRVSGTEENYATDLRFIAQMGRTVFDNVKATQPTKTTDTDIGFGFVVLPKDLLGEKVLTKNTDKAAIVPAVKLYSNNSTDDYIQYTVCLTGIPLEKAQLEREYTVRPYVTYTDSLGEVRTVYGDAYATSLANIAKQIAKNESDPYYAIVKNNILDHLGNSTESN